MTITSLCLQIRGLMIKCTILTTTRQILIKRWNERQIHLMHREILRQSRRIPTRIWLYRVRALKHTELTFWKQIIRETVLTRAMGHRLIGLEKIQMIDTLTSNCKAFHTNDKWKWCNKSKMPSIPQGCLKARNLVTKNSRIMLNRDHLWTYLKYQSRVRRRVARETIWGLLKVV